MKQNERNGCQKCQLGIGGVDPVHLFLSLSLKTVFHWKPPPISILAVASKRKNLNKSHFTTLFLNKCISKS